MKCGSQILIIVYKPLFFIDLLPRVTPFHLMLFQRVIPAMAPSSAGLEQQLGNLRELLCHMRSWQRFFEKRVKLVLWRFKFI